MIREHRSRSKLEAYYQNYTEKGVLDPNVHPWVAASWQRSQKHGVKQDKLDISHRLASEKFHELQQSHRTAIDYLGRLSEGIKEFFQEYNLSLLLVDADCVVLKSYSLPFYQMTPGEIEGVRVGEAEVGTSSISVAYEMKAPFWMFGPEMWVRECQLGDACSAPVFVNGEFRYIVTLVSMEPVPMPQDAVISLLFTMRTALEQHLEAELRITAEIMANRELAGVQRGGKGLENRPDPAAVAERTEELAAEMAKVYKKDPKTMNNLVAQATSGHGGKMMEAYEKVAQPTREAAKPITYLDYINKLDLEKPTYMDVAKLVAATAMYIDETEGVRAVTSTERVNRIAAKINASSAFQKVMKNPQVLQNAKMGLGLPIVEQLKKEQQAELKERDRKQAERDKDTIRENEVDPEWRKNMDKTFLSQLKHQGEWGLFDSEARQNAQQYLENSPGCRAEAMEIIEEYNLKGLWVPKLCEMPDEQLNDPEKHKAALQKQQEQEKQPKVVKPEKGGAEIGGVGK